MTEEEFQERVKAIQARRGKYPFLAKARRGQDVPAADLAEARRSVWRVNGSALAVCAAIGMAYVTFDGRAWPLTTLILAFVIWMPVFLIYGIWQKQMAIRAYRELAAERDANGIGGA